MEKYIQMAKLRQEEAFIDDSEYSANLWGLRVKLAKEKLIGLKQNNLLWKQK